MLLRWPKPNRNFTFVDALGITGACGFLVARFVPVARLPFWGCAVRQLTGIPCPGCGLTRVADRLAHGNFLAAWDANPLGAIVAVLFAACMVLSAVHLAFGLPLPNLELSKREVTAVRYTVIGLVILNYAFMVVKTKFPGIV